MAIVEVKNLFVEINNKSILKDINIKFNTQERILILGESGSGKSTLLLSLMGIIQRFENADVKGDVIIDDVSVRDMEPLEIASIFGIVFQDPESQFCSLYPKDEIAFGLENRCMEPYMMDERIKYAMKAFNFPMEKENQLINNLSGGQQQRLALSCSHALESKMYLMDEPTANLDPKGRFKVVQTSIQASLNGKGLLVIEHNLEHWLPFLQRIIVLKSDGSILCDGETREMFHRYGEQIKDNGMWYPKTFDIYNSLKRKGYKCSKIPFNIAELMEEKIPLPLIDEIIDSEFDFQIIKAEKEKRNPLLVINELIVGYNKTHKILKGLSLNIYEGDFFALVGGNGSGKTTLSKVILRLLNINSGSISIMGKNLLEYKEQELYELIGYVFQNPEHQFLKDTVWSELSYSIEQLEIDEKSRIEQINSLLDAFHLKSKYMSNPFTLSGGQKRRLSVATMLVGERKILILDEPTFGQDEKNETILMNKLTELNKQGMTIFIITHDLDLVDRYANKTAVMYDGTIIYNGDTQTLWTKPSIIKKSELELPYRIKLKQEVMV